MINKRSNQIGFAYHLTAYLAANAVMIWINLDTSPEYFWAKWPLTGWLVAILFHAYSVFSSSIKKYKEFYDHLASYLIVNLFLIFINFDTYPQYFWFKFPLVAWTIMIIFHAWRVFSGKRIIDESSL